MDISERIKKATEDIAKIQMELAKQIGPDNKSIKAVEINSNRLQKTNKLLDTNETRTGDVNEQVLDILNSILE